ncbi:PspC domain-containing protein [Flavobacterium aciduliphilum]|uniref:Phage shock protein C (PspC) family protein n=1 Tax=Flavobacterium aciduliphilum TaxID=1101402 RepID=A0A328YN47_9FLAO|nr:PspC domain-containing protein [Flavobacterium aciduliphilum]RAR75481.1 phage shock protein C (PspC) family protein [Flavobacterium aciduliphilum]
MNKTVNINIGGLFFHIDEDAYQKISKYFDAIQKSLSNTSGKEEVMKDIEMRVAEIFSERQKSDKHVINIKDVDEVVAVMGQPEDYRIDGNDNEPETSSTQATAQAPKKLYRDRENGLIGGVCTGLSHYFGIDAVWIKIIFILLIWAGGAGIIGYLVFWIATPEAITTAEKLEMRGEPVTISNIEKKVREEFENVSEKFKNVNYDALGNRVKTGAESVGTKIGVIFSNIFSAFAKVLGAFILILSSVMLFGVTLVSLVAIFSTSLPQNTLINHFRTPLGLETPLWIQGVLFLLSAGIPLFLMIMVGLKLMINRTRTIGTIAKYALLGIWVLAIGVLFTLGINEFTQISSESKVVTKQTIGIAPTDTLLVKFKNNDFYSKEVEKENDFRLTQDEQNHDIIYSNNVSIKVMKTDDKIPYLQVEKLAVGKSSSEAKKRAEQIKYAFRIEKNMLILDNYLLTEVANKFRDQRVELFLYLPKGTLFKMDKSVIDFDDSNNEFFNLHHSSEDYIYRVDDAQVKCLNCPSDEDEYNDVETEDVHVIHENDSVKTVSVRINGKEVIETTTGKNKASKLIINNDGIIVKTK